MIILKFGARVGVRFGHRDWQVQGSAQGRFTLGQDRSGIGTGRPEAEYIEFVVIDKVSSHSF